jgi:hypothetical protein
MNPQTKTEPMNRYEVNRDVFTALLMIVSSSKVKITFDDESQRLCIGTCKAKEDPYFQDSLTLVRAIDLLQRSLAKSFPKPIISNES